MSERGVKYDDGKIDYDIVEPIMIEAIAKTMNEVPAEVKHKKAQMEKFKLSFKPFRFH